MNDITVAEKLAEDVSIASRAMKAIFHRGVGAARRTRDAAAEEAVKEQFGDEGQLVTKRLFVSKDGMVYKRSQLASEMYLFHMRTTLPHTDDGSRVLPNAAYFDYVTKMGNYETELTRFDQWIITNYDTLVQEDVVLRNSALVAKGKTPIASAADYPSLDKMKRYLYVEWRVEPIATANDFRYDVSDQVKERFSQALTEVESVAKLDIFRRLLTPIQKFADKLDRYEGEKGQKFHDSFIDNIVEMADSLPMLNFDNDPRVTEIIDEVKKAVMPYKFNPSALRELADVRENAKVKMKGLIDKFADYGLTS